MITCKSGITIRTGVDSIREAGRATQGVKLIRIEDDDEIAAITQLDKEEDEQEIVEGLETDGTLTTETESSENDPEAGATDENQANTDEDNTPS
jgi:DNA gyrase subunit A